MLLGKKKSDSFLQVLRTAASLILKGFPQILRSPPMPWTGDDKQLGDHSLKRN